MTPREWIRESALGLGFDAAGFAAAPAPGEPFLPGLRFRDWLAAGHGGAMSWLGRSAHLRADPLAAFPPLRSAVVLLERYAAAEEPQPGQGRVAAYARGSDYHNRLARRARKLLRRVLERWPGNDGHTYVDRGAVLEKAWAERAGLGWIGKNSLLLAPGVGSRTLIALLFLTLELPADEPVADQCGACTLCLDACPTGSFAAPRVLDARRCISYLTIETRGEIPLELRAAMGDHVFGCDVCQDVCPFNQVGAASAAPSSSPLHEDLAGILGVDEEGFVTLTRGRPLGRPGREALVRNACVAAGNSGDAAHVPALRRLLGDASEVVRSHAAWAIAALGASSARAAGAGVRPGDRGATSDPG